MSDIERAFRAMVISVVLKAIVGVAIVVGVIVYVAKHW
jgi:hypothetical protein